MRERIHRSHETKARSAVERFVHAQEHLDQILSRVGPLHRAGVLARLTPHLPFEPRKHRYLLSLGGLVYPGNLPDKVAISAPEAGTVFEIVDVPFGDGTNYDQHHQVCRETAESLCKKAPDMWRLIP